MNSETDKIYKKLATYSSELKELTEQLGNDIDLQTAFEKLSNASVVQGKIVKELTKLIQLKNSRINTLEQLLECKK